MQESTLLKVSLIVSLIGIFLILLISEKISLPTSNINLINETHIDKNVKVKGIVESIAETPGLIILTLKDTTGSITVIIFKDEELKLEKNSLIEVEGTVVKYKNKLEINAKKVKIF